MHRSVAFWAGCPLGRPHSGGHSSQVSQPIPPGTWSVARALRYPHISGVSKDPPDRRSRYGAGAIGLLVARHFGTSADFRMNVQKDYELLLTRHKSLKTFKRQVRRRSLSARTLSLLGYLHGLIQRRHLSIGILHDEAHAIPSGGRGERQRGV